jgi:hypothetical protein
MARHLVNFKTVKYKIRQPDHANDALIECLDVAINSVWRCERRKAWPGRIFSIADLATKVEEALNCGFEDDYHTLANNVMAYVKVELRKRCRRARGIVWSER